MSSPTPEPVAACAPEEPGRPLTFEGPTDPPQLTPLAARALLKLVLDVHSKRQEAEQQSLVWDRTA